MVLAIDIANAATSFGAFDADGTLLFFSELPTSARSTRDQCAIGLKNIFALHGAQLTDVCGCIVSSVVPAATAATLGAVTLLTSCTPTVMGPGVKTGLNIKSDIHAQMGSDLVASAVATLAAYPSPSIVIDFGTAITLSVLADKTFEGCVILPGVEVSLEALSQHAAELPHISLEVPSSILGHNTVDAMRAGMIFGTASMVDGMLERLEAASAPAASVIATGHGAMDILVHCNRSIAYDETLLLKGLYLIYCKNFGKK